MKVFNRGVQILGPLLAPSFFGKLFGTGHVYYVKPSTSADYASFIRENQVVYENGKKAVYDTLDAALAATTASVGDVVIIAPEYTETVTAVKTLSKAGVSIIGLGSGMLRPTITGNAAIDVFDVTAANVTIENIIFPAPETDDQTADINVAAAGCTIRNTYHIGSKTSKNKTDIITVASGGDDLLVEGVRAYNTVVDCVSWLSLEAAVARPRIKNCIVQGTFSTGVLMDEATATLALVEDCVFKNTKAATAVVTFTTGNTTGVFNRVSISGRHTTLASNVVTGTGMDFFDTKATEEAGTNGIVIPAAEAD